MKKLRVYLRQQGLSNQSFADEVGVSIFAVRKWLNGERTPRDKTKVKIARATKNVIKVQDWLNGLKS